MRRKEPAVHSPQKVRFLTEINDNPSHVTLLTEQDDPNEEDVVEIESDDEFGLLADEELDEDDDIPVSYNNALILNEVWHTTKYYSKFDHSFEMMIF